MKQVIEQYASTMIGVITGIVLILIITGIQIEDDKGVFSILGNAVKRKFVVQETTFSKTAFDQYKNVTAPTIKVQNAYAIEAGKRVLPKDCFVAIDGNENVLWVQVNAGWKEDGSPIELNLLEDGSFCIENAGVYWVSACAEDGLGYRREVLFKCIVNERSIR